MRILQNLHIDWMGHRKFFYALSLTIFLAGMINIVFRGLEFGIDFKGGTEVEIQLDKPVDIHQMRMIASKIGLGDMEVKSFGGDRNVLLRTELQDIPENIGKSLVTSFEADIAKQFPGLEYQQAPGTAKNAYLYSFIKKDTITYVVSKVALMGYRAAKQDTMLSVQFGVSDWVKRSMKTALPDYEVEIRRTEVIGPKVGGELKRDAILSVLLSLLGILVYLGFRYKFIFAAGAVLALFHDVLITLGLFAILYGLIPGLNLEINLTVIAAFLTLIGYSSIDTIIVFDRIREMIKLHKNEDLMSIMNLSINRTMSRTILTGGTTFLSCLVLLIFGGEVIRAFAFTLTFGIITGTYSSIFVASSIVLDYVKKADKKIQF